MSDPILIRLRQARAPAVAQAFRGAQQTILDRWGEMVRQHLPDADALTFTGLRDELPESLEELAATLDDPSSSHKRDLLHRSRSHGACRFHQRFRLDELLQEYAILRSVIIEELFARLDRPITPDEMAALDAGLDELIRRGVLAFTDYQKKKVQAAAEAQSKYLSFMSHDIRGSLNSILLMVDVLQHELKDHAEFGASIDDLNLMRRSILETANMMSRFLQAERLRKGRIKLELKPLILRQLVEEVVAQFALQAASRGIRLQVQIESPGQVVSDRELIMMILQNLLSNAIKYSGKGTIRVRLTDYGHGCRISIQDEGAGIPKEQVEALFAPFERGNTFGQPGVGLGLAIVRQAVEHVKARLHVESTPGEGSTFAVEIPHSPPRRHHASP